MKDTTFPNGYHGYPNEREFNRAHENEVYCSACESHPCRCDDDERRYRDLEAEYDAKLDREIRDHFAMLDHVDEERNRDQSLDYTSEDMGSAIEAATGRSYQRGYGWSLS